MLQGRSKKKMIMISIGICVLFAMWSSAAKQQPGECLLNFTQTFMTEGRLNLIYDEDELSLITELNSIPRPITILKVDSSYTKSRLLDANTNYIYSIKQESTLNRTIARLSIELRLYKAKHLVVIMDVKANKKSAVNEIIDIFAYNNVDSTVAAVYDRANIDFQFYTCTKYVCDKCVQYSLLGRCGSELTDPFAREPSRIVSGCKFILGWFTIDKKNDYFDEHELFFSTFGNAYNLSVE